MSPMEDGMKRWSATCYKCGRTVAQPITSVDMVFCECGQEIWQDGREQKALTLPQLEYLRVGGKEVPK